MLLAQDCFINLTVLKCFYEANNSELELVLEEFD
jgi:hypothetical protein